jgi:two-component sensor histidine kinase
VRWQRQAPDGATTKLRLEWLEEGGPRVVAPAEAGYGSSVIRDLIPYELGGAVELNFGPSGVACVIEISVAQDVVRLVNPSTDFEVLRAAGAEASNRCTS